MKLVKFINKEALLQAMRECDKTNEIYDALKKNYPNAEDKISKNGVDSRDLADLALFMRYKNVINKSGEALSDEEFEEEVSKIIEAFLTDDREKIFEYLDEWFDFAANFDPNENIETEEEALALHIYLRSQQGLPISKMNEYPDYVLSRFQDKDSLMKLQRVKTETFLQTGLCDVLYIGNGVKTNTSSIRDYDNNGGKPSAEMEVLQQVMIEEKESRLKKVGMSMALLDSFKLKDKTSETGVSVEEFKIPEWVNQANNLDPKSREYREILSDVHDVIAQVSGSHQTGYGIIGKYLDGMHDIGYYKLIYIDGNNLFDSLEKPVTTEKADARLVEALTNKKEVVSFVQLVEINGKFDYKINVLDVREGNENDNPEYVQKIEEIKNSKEKQEQLYDKINLNLKGVLTMGKTTKYYANRNVLKQEATDVVEGRRVIGKEEPIQVEKKNFGSAYFVIDETRRAYNSTIKSIVENTDEGREFIEQGFDARDFQDIVVFTKLAKTLGVGKKDLDDKEFKLEIEYLAKAFGSQDHEMMKPYLDKMYDFIENYKMPKVLSSTEDIIKALMYVRVQQTSTVKILENPWYLNERCPSVEDKARFNAMEAVYFNKYTDLLDAMVKETGLYLGKGQLFSEIIKQAKLGNPAEDDEQDESDFEREERLENEKRDARIAEYRDLSKRYNTERQLKLQNADDVEKCYTFKLNLPSSAYMNLLGDQLDAKDVEEAAEEFKFGFIANVYNSDYNDARLLRKYGLTTSLGFDPAYLIFIDGKSLYDFTVEQDGKYNYRKAYEKLNKILVDRTGLVQFARVFQGEYDEIKVELDTIEIANTKIDNQEYYQKLADFENHSLERLNLIKNNINEVCKARRTEIDKAKAEAEEKDLFNIGDVFDSREAQVKKHDGLENVYKVNRFNAIHDVLNDIEMFTGSKVNNNQFLERFEAVFSSEELNVSAYNTLWRELWKQAMEGLINKAYSDEFGKSVPFSYITGIVERCMKGSLKLYGHAETDVEPFGGNTSDILKEELEILSPSFESYHFKEYNPGEDNGLILGNGKMNIEEQLNVWSNMPVDAFKNMEGYLENDPIYRDEEGKLTEEGKKWASNELIKLYDRVNVMIERLPDEMLVNYNDPNASFDLDFDKTPEEVENLQNELRNFNESLKSIIIIDIGVVNEDEFKKLTGTSIPIEKEIEKFKVNMDKLLSIESNLEDERKAQYVKDEEKQWNNLVNADLELFEDDEVEEKAPIKKLSEAEIQSRKNISKINKNFNKAKAKIERNKIKQQEADARLDAALKKATKIDLTKYKDGRYNITNKSGNSSYNIVTKGELSNLGVYFGGMFPQNGSSKLVNILDYNDREYVDHDEVFDNAIELGSKYATYINIDSLKGAIEGFVLANQEGNNVVDKNVFELQYKLLFTDLYTSVLHSLNKKNCIEGKTMSINQMTKSMNLLNSIMTETCKEIGYPTVIENGGYNAREIKELREKFVNDFVPRNSEEIALRQMQAASNEYNFESNTWKEGLGYTAFRGLINAQMKKVQDNKIETPAEKKNAAQAYRAMVMYSKNRTGWSKFINYFGKYRDEKNVIAQYKAAVMQKANLTERDFNDLLAVENNNKFESLKGEVAQQYNLDKTKKVEKDDISVDNSFVEKISVPEADHNSSIDKSMNNSRDSIIVTNKKDLDESSSLDDSRSLD